MKPSSVGWRQAPQILSHHRAMAAATSPNRAPKPLNTRPHEVPHPTLSADTDPAAERVQLAIYRDMTPARKLQLVLEAISLSRDLALAGLRTRYPTASPAELRRRLYGLELGEELAVQVYGPPTEGSSEP